MKLAVFFPASLFSAWACSYGLVDCLRRMGHEVVSVGVDPQSGKLQPPRGPDLASIDGFIVSGPEHIVKPIEVAYPGWHKKTGRPKVAWLHETIEREDYGKLDVEAIKRSADVIFCPAIQDEKYGFRYLPFGVDTEIFKPYPGCACCDYCDSWESPEKSVDAAFIGLLYPKRQAFLAELKKHGVNLVTGNVQVLELGGINPRKTAELYAENIRKIKVFVNLPTLSQLAVTKIYEVLACGTMLLTPEVADMRNLEGLPCRTYDGSDPSFAAQRISLNVKAIPEWLRSKHGEHGVQLIHDKHRLELRCEVLISALKELGAKSSHESLATA